jgi:hypothetical protein
MLDLSPEFWKWIGGQIGVLVIAYFGLKQTVAVLSTRHDSLEQKFDAENKEIKEKLETLSDLLVKSARYEERQARADEHILLIRKDLDDIKHYKGFVTSGPVIPPSVS